jgi:hypothetical protein
MNSVLRFHWTVCTRKRTIQPSQHLFIETKEPVMSPRNVLESQQSAPALQAGRSAAGCWKLANGRALSLVPHTHGVLEIAQGRVWVTLGGVGADLPGAAADHVLHAGEQLRIAPGQHVVMEAWGLSGSVEAVAFRWEGAMASATSGASPGASLAARDWECGVVQPLRDLLQALGQGGRALGTTLVDVTGAGGRFAAGLARFAMHRIAPQRQRRPA